MNETTEKLANELDAIRRALNAAPDSNLASLAETVMAQRRLLALAIAEYTRTGLVSIDGIVLARSILSDEPAPAASSHCVACGGQTAQRETTEGDWRYIDCLGCGYRSGWRYVDGRKVVMGAVDTDGWISVHDRLPREGENVLVIDACGIPWLADYTPPNEYGGDIWSTEADLHSEITHWQPLPPLPSKKGE